MKLRFFALLVFTLSMTGHAAELRILGGNSGHHPCETETLALLEMARESVLRQLGNPSRFRRVSEWNESAYQEGWHYAPDSCRYSTAWAAASFVELNDLDSDWEVTLKGSFTNPRSEPKPDSEAWARATEDALRQANFYCGGAAETRPLQVQATKNDFNGDGWYSLYLVKARFRCLKTIFCDPIKSPFCSL